MVMLPALPFESYLKSRLKTKNNNNKKHHEASLWRVLPTNFCIMFPITFSLNSCHFSLPTSPHIATVWGSCLQLCDFSNVFPTPQWPSVPSSTSSLQSISTLMSLSYLCSPGQDVPWLVPVSINVYVPSLSMQGKQRKLLSLHILPSLKDGLQIGNTRDSDGCDQVCANVILLKLLNLYGKYAEINKHLWHRKAVS